MKTANVEQARKLLSIGGFGLLLGIGLSAVGHGSFGSWISLVAVVLAAAGLHRFGRLGPDETRIS